MIVGAKTQSALNHLAEIINGDITMLFETEQIDEDERAWAVKTVNDALYERAEELRNALKEPPNHEH
jgi:5'-deoxynucleotidase YfbR-like HD superfamily hydrolase